MLTLVKKPLVNLCVVIPVYDHEHAIGDVVAELLSHDLPCILVDDGCSAACARVLDALLAAEPDKLSLVRHKTNCGKGAAVLSGITCAVWQGYSHVLQVDADGQHCIADVPYFSAMARQYPDAIIVGYPVYEMTAQKSRLYARYLTHLWVWINTLSLQIKDSMCGFRVYPVQAVMAVSAKNNLGNRMEFDTEIFTRMHIFLFFGMLLRFPHLFFNLVLRCARHLRSLS